MNPPCKNPTDAAKYRQQYMSNLALDISNMQQNLNANMIFKNTGQTPSQMTDNRTSTDKQADIEGLKTSIRSFVTSSGICNSMEASKVVQELSPDQLLFVSQYKTFMMSDFKGRNIPAPVFYEYVKKLITKEQTARGVDLGLQQQTGSDILLGIQQIVGNMVGQQDIVDAVNELRGFRHVVTEGLLHQIIVELQDLSRIIPSEAEIKAIFTANGNPHQAAVQQQANSLLQTMPTKQVLQKQVAAVNVAAAHGDTKAADKALLAISNTISVTPQEAAERAALLAQPSAAATAIAPPTKASANPLGDALVTQYQKLYGAAPTAAATATAATTASTASTVPYDSGKAATSTRSALGSLFDLVTGKSPAKATTTAATTTTSAAPQKAADTAAATAATLNRMNAVVAALPQKAAAATKAEPPSTILPITVTEFNNLALGAKRGYLKTNFEILKHEPGAPSKAQITKAAASDLERWFELVQRSPLSHLPFLATDTADEVYAKHHHNTAVGAQTIIDRGDKRLATMNGTGLSLVISEKKKPHVLNLIKRGDVDGEIKKLTPYKQLGKYFINAAKLNDNICMIKHASGKSHKDLPSHHVSQNVADIIKIVGAGFPVHQEHIAGLGIEERNHLHKIFSVCGVVDNPIRKSMTKSSDQAEMDRYEILRGEVIAGSDSKVLIKELKLLILKLMHDGRLPRKEALDVLVELSAQGF